MTGSVPFAAEEELERFTQLHGTFSELTAHRRDLQLRGSPAPPPLGFALRLQPSPTSAGVELSLWLDGGLLSVWSAAVGPGRSGAVAERFLRLDLAAGFRWETLLFPRAQELARTLLQWMDDQLAQRDGRTSLEA